MKRQRNSLVDAIKHGNLALHAAWVPEIVVRQELEIPALRQL